MPFPRAYVRTAAAYARAGVPPHAARQLALLDRHLVERGAPPLSLVVARARLDARSPHVPWAHVRDAWRAVEDAAALKGAAPSASFYAARACVAAGPGAREALARALVTLEDHVAAQETR